MACSSNGNGSTSSSKIRFLINLVNLKTDVDNEATYFPPALTPSDIEEYNVNTGEPKPDIRLSFWSSSLKTLLTTNFDENEQRKLQLDGIVDNLKEELSVTYFNKRDEFLALYEDEFSFRPYGELINKFTHKVRGKMRSFEIYFTDFESDTAFLEVHHRLETFALLFIDGARRIQVDSRWCCFCVYEVQKSPKKRYLFIGYSTVYRFFVMPIKLRPRVSQFFIVPPYQRCGIGKILLRVVLSTIQTWQILEITVEEPCDAFLELRDIVDAERILTALPSLIPQILDPNPFSRLQVINEFHKRLYIPNKRAGHMYEIVKLYCILKNDPERIEGLRKEVEGRLTSQRQNEANISQRQRRHGLRSQELTEQGRPAVPANQIEEEFQNLFKKYESIVQKLILSEPEWNNPK